MSFKSRLFACKVAAGQRIASLGLTTPEGDDLNLVVLKLPKDKLPGAAEFPANNLLSGTPTFPMVQVTHSIFGENISQGFGNSARVDITYPVQINIMAVDNVDLIANEDYYDWWREQILVSFAGQWLTGVDQIWYTTLSPYVPIDPTVFFEKDLFHSALVLEFHEHRQVNTIYPDPAPIPG